MSRRIELEIVGLTGEDSARQAEAALRGNHGVLDVRILTAQGRAFVDVSPGVILEHLLESLESSGFLARPAGSDEDD